MPVLPVAVTITGAGDSRDCYAIINGTKRYRAGTYEVNTGDTIKFYINSKSERDDGAITIDGEDKAIISVGSVTYDWIVPDGTSTVKIAMSYSDRIGTTITVTTA